MKARQRVLILCTGNSCRSQLAERLWGHLGEPAWEAASAGSRPAGFVHPLALAALAEVGLGAPDAESRSLDVFAGQSFDLVVTVCDGAAEACPVFPGAGRRLHWPFEDPALARGDDAEVMPVFRRVRDRILATIAGHLEQEAGSSATGLADPGLALAAWTTTVLAQWPGGCHPELAARLQRLVTRLRAAPANASPWRELPAAIAAEFGGCGWAWNGIYRREGERLTLAVADGPPVCATLLLEGPGGVGSSGMCWDAILRGQPVFAGEVERWPGYVSCDGESGLRTWAGIAVPLRAAGGRIVAVWDLDSTEPLDPAAGPLLAAFLSTLTSLYPLPDGDLA